MEKNKFTIADVKIDEANNPFIYDSVVSGLREFNTPWLGPSKLQHFTLYIADSSKNVIAGALGALRQYKLTKTAWVHKIWVKTSCQRLGLGTDLIRFLEDFAWHRNCERIQLEAFDFQNIEFFKKQGYQVQGIIPKALADLDQYCLYKKHGVESFSSTNFSHILLDETGNHDIKQVIFNGVKNYNNAYLGLEDFKDFSIYIERPTGVIIGGITGSFSRKYAKIQVVWVDQSYRSHGLGRILWQKLEDYLISKECSLILVGTLEFHAKTFYEKLGCKYQGTISNWMGGYDQYWFKKTIIT